MGLHLLCSLFNGNVGVKRMENNMNKQELRAQYEYRRRKSAEGMRLQLISFGLMAFLTIISFLAVGYGLPKSFVVPILLLLASVQALFQLYYFMHASEKGHGMVMFFMYSAMFVAFITVLCYMTIIWW